MRKKIPIKNININQHNFYVILLFQESLFKGSRNKAIIKSIIKKEIGLEEEEIYKKINNHDLKKKGITETWRLFQLYIHLRDEKMLDDMINNLYS